jgi:hypothetical protein
MKMPSKASFSVLVSLVLIAAGCAPSRQPGDGTEPLGASRAALSATLSGGLGTNGNSVKKTFFGDGWGDTSAASVQTLQGDGYVQFTTAESWSYRMAGLTHAVTDAGYATIDYAIYLLGDGTVEIWEGGVPINGGASFGSYAPEDVFTVQVTDTVVTYLQNGALLYTSAQTPTFPLRFDASIYSELATVNDVNLVSTPFWQNLVGVSASGHSLTKTAADGWDSGAWTTASLSGDGYAEFRVGETTSYKMAGLTHAVTDASYATIDFGIYPLGTGAFEIWESGVPVNGGAPFGSYAANDVFRVSVTNGVVTYLQNGALVYTSTQTPTFPLVFDASLYSQEATLGGVKFTGTSPWVDVVGVTVSGASLTKTAADGWNSGGTLAGSLNGDGYFEFTATANDTYFMAGPTHAVRDSGYTTIDFAVYPVGFRLVYIYEKGSQVFTGGAYAPGDVFRVQVSSGVVTYLQNGVVIYTSTQKPVLPLLFDTSLYTQGAEIRNVSMVAMPVAWQDVSGVRISGASLTKTGAAGWNAGAALVTTLTGDGYTEFTTAETSTNKMAGLTHAVSDNGFATIDFGIYLDAGLIYVYEQGVRFGGVDGFGSFAAGDVFRVQVSSGVVSYLKNGSLFYTSTQTPSPTLLFDASLYSKGASVNNVILAPSSSFWQHPVGVAFSGSSNMTKTSSDGWDAGASSIGSLSGDGYLQFTTGEATSYKMIGLTHTIADSGFATIDFGVFLTSDGSVDVFEDGTEISSTPITTYAAGDIFRVEVTGGVVSYAKNGSTFYTSMKTVTFPLAADASLYTNGATIQNATLSP